MQVLLSLELGAGCQQKASFVKKGLKSEAKTTIRELLAPQLKLSNMRKRMLSVQDSVWKNVAAALHLSATLPHSHPKGSRKRTSFFAIEIPRSVVSTMTLPRKAHAVVFDVDGLIFDTEPLYRGAMISAARESGHDMKLEVYHSIIGLSVEATRALLSEHFGRRFDFEVFWATASKQFYGRITTLSQSGSR
jgi:hypothetical protein